MNAYPDLFVIMYSKVWATEDAQIVIGYEGDHKGRQQRIEDLKLLLQN